MWQSSWTAQVHAGEESLGAKVAADHHPSALLCRTPRRVCTVCSYEMRVLHSHAAGDVRRHRHGDTRARPTNAPGGRAKSAKEYRSVEIRSLCVLTGNKSVQRGFIPKKTNLELDIIYSITINLNIGISKFVLLEYVTFSIGWFFMGQMDYELQPDRGCCRLDESICALCRWKKNGKKRLLWIFFSSFFHFSCIPRAQVRQVTAYSAWLCRW